MIYLKRFCFVIIGFLCITVGIVGTLLEIILYPIWGIICYVITGYDHLDNLESSFSWAYTMKFLDWYQDKFDL